MRQKAVDDEEAYLMVDACEKVRDALAGVGYNPRQLPTQALFLRLSQTLNPET